jgi:hypothetical protein
MVVMNENAFEKMEDYLQGKMSPEERTRFEAEMASDAALSTSYKIYAAIDEEMQEDQKYKQDEAALKGSLDKLNTTYFITNKAGSKREISIAASKVYKVITAIAATLIIVTLSYFLLNEQKNGAKKLAGSYVNDNLSELSQTLDRSNDSMQQGIAAYNKKDYSAAISLFEGLYRQDTTNAEAIKNAGLGYLLSKDYDKAYEAFDILSKKKDLFSNPGLFYTAITLLQRNKENDREKAKQLLEAIVKKKGEGFEDAEKLLEKL